MSVLQKSLIINEIFSSIQGESSYAGEPFIFIRLSGCNLRCKYCDTSYAWQGGKKISLGAVFSEIKKFRPIRKVLITGGEPLWQPDVKVLASLLVKKGYLVLIETNGSISIRGFPKEVIFILDVKTPSSGMAEKNLLSNIKVLKTDDEVKFVISGKADYLWVVAFFRKHKINAKILFSPVEGKLALKSLAKWVMRDRLDVKLQSRLHKMISMR